ncbi:unnamed protein product [Prorocentrum cordatum]|uniref:Bifunctional lysine-specific demethylase and histidyl-hydroxylase n=1 Tax=Prorocentrum cordatum TaxID=2364126 RepID=A0ABN9TJH6_9DINO|nr:unnamed protein product [Polarella glacialis]
MTERRPGALPADALACLHDGLREAHRSSKEDVARQLRSRAGLHFERDINLARCVAGKQVMQNGRGQAEAAAVAAAVAEGCSVQVVHPQRFAPAVAALLARLEGFFGCLWGANSFRTPPASRGFKAHHDEVEVFMLQLEGAKNWTLHSCPAGPLPQGYCWDRATTRRCWARRACRCASVPGTDLLYLPRGTVHRGSAVDGEDPAPDSFGVLMGGAYN